MRSRGCGGLLQWRPRTASKPHRQNVSGLTASSQLQRETITQACSIKHTFRCDSCSLSCSLFGQNKILSCQVRALIISCYPLSRAAARWSTMKQQGDLLSPQSAGAGGQGEGARRMLTTAQPRPEQAPDLGNNTQSGIRSQMQGRPNRWGAGVATRPSPACGGPLWCRSFYTLIRFLALNRYLQNKNRSSSRGAAPCCCPLPSHCTRGAGWPGLKGGRGAKKPRKREKYIHGVG